MPYIAGTRRKALDRKYLAPSRAGELAYVLYGVVMDYWRHQGPSYQAVADILGALETTKQEFYRHCAEPYEDGKREENGDV